MLYSVKFAWNRLYHLFIDFDLYNLKNICFDENAQAIFDIFVKFKLRLRLQEALSRMTNRNVLKILHWWHIKEAVR